MDEVKRTRTERENNNRNMGIKVDVDFQFLVEREQQNVPSQRPVSTELQINFPLAHSRWPVED